MSTTPNTHPRMVEVSYDFLKKCEEESKEKEDELKFFCKMLNHKDKDKVMVWFKKNVDLLGVKDYSLMIKVSQFISDFSEHKVDGKIWNNGSLGSRWSDKVDGCRIAFYSRKLDPSICEDFSDYNLTKNYLLIVMTDF